MRDEEVHARLRRRCDDVLRQTHLEVDYYRVRRRLAVPLPVRQLTVHRYPMQFDPSRYPWSIWLTWALEERLHCLGWAAQWLDDDAAAARAEAELAALATWPRYHQHPQPDLSLAHALRTMLAALRHWPWLETSTQTALRGACARAIEQLVDWYDHDRPGHTPRAVNDDPAHRIHQNIPVIGTLALAAAARHIEHDQHERLHRQARAIVDHLLALRDQGFTEGVAYDGYVLDFLADWLEGEPAEVRRAVLQHPQIDGWITPSLALGAPGAVLAAAPIGDVEPREMAFHVTALAKAARFEPRGDVCWLLRTCHLDWLRTETLAQMRRLEDIGEWRPPTGAVDAHYATVLRSGVDADDVAVVASSSRSTMGHGHADAGTIVIGHAGRWWIDDPGYQQYLDTSERQFTMGPTAHNCPRIAGIAQTKRGAGRVLRCEQVDDETVYAAIDMTAGYELDVLERAVRHLWLVGRRAVVLADEIHGAPGTELTWHWHGHPDVAWRVEPRRVLLYHDARHLWLSAPQLALDEAMVERLRGSRGQLTLTATRTVEAATSVTWWLFQLEAEAIGPIDATDAACHWLDRTFAPA